MKTVNTDPMAVQTPCMVTQFCICYKGIFPCDTSCSVSFVFMDLVCNIWNVILIDVDKTYLWIVLLTLKVLW